MDLLSLVQKNLTSEDDKCRFAAAWSAALLGDLNSVPVLKAIAGLDVSYKEEAATVACSAHGSWRCLEMAKRAC